MVKTVFNFSLVLVFGLLLSQTVAAQTTQPAWTWENYVGVTQWRVDVTEDETACGAEKPTTTPYTISIQHNLTTAEVGDYGHGEAKGTFAGNTLSMLERTIPDGKGKSKLFGFDMTFTPDCSGFTGKYYWDYNEEQHPENHCGGSTTLSGIRTDGKGCPAAAQQSAEQQRKEIADARAELDNARRESRYKDILAKDPQNFWANWDMAELKKSQGDYRGFLDYFDRAVNNEKNFQETREKLRKEAAKRLHLSEPPTTANSLLLKSIVDQLNSGNEELVYNVNFPKGANNEKWYVKLWRAYNRKSQDIVYELAGWPR